MVMSPSLVDDVKQRASRRARAEAYPAGFPVLPPVPAGRYADPGFADARGRRRCSAARGSWSPTPTSCPSRATTGARPAPAADRARARRRRPLRAFYNTCKHRGAALVLERRERRAAPHLPVPQLGRTTLEGELVGYPERAQLLRPRSGLPRPHRDPLRDVGPADLHQPRPGRRAARRVPGQVGDDLSELGELDGRLRLVDHRSARRPTSTGSSRSTPTSRRTT